MYIWGDTMKNIILFGAGASYGSGRIIPEEPPLLPQLYPQLKRCYPRTWGNLPKNLMSRFAENFELGMADMWDKYSQRVPQLMQEMALHFVQFRPANIKENLYFKLLQFLAGNNKISSTVLFTLNYEVILDLCAQALDLNVDPENKTHDENTIKIIKLHGACNIIPDGIKLSRSVRFTKGVLFGTGAKYLFDLNEVVKFCLGDNGLPPIMALIMKEKPIQVSKFILNHYQNIWREILEGKHKLIVIGVNPNNDDTHIWNPLMTTLSKIHYVGDPRPVKGLESKFLSKPVFLGKKFHECLDKIFSIFMED